jgi:hypothetical protein
LKLIFTLIKASVYHEISLAGFLAAIACGCASTSHEFDGKQVVLEGRWNSWAKEAGQILCTTEPKTVNVVGINGRPTPEHDQVVRVQAVLHWRGTTERQKRAAERSVSQLAPDGYIIDWSRATWEPKT